MTLNTIRRLSLGTKLTTANIALTALMFGAFLLAISITLSRSVEQQAKTDVSAKIELLVNMIQAADQDLRQRTEGLAKVFNTSLNGGFELKPETVDIKGRATPVLSLGGRTLNLDFTAVDAFSAATGGVATLFAKSGDDYVRVSTSVKNEKGERAVGTLLDREHPGYKAIAAGKSYVGTATLFGRQYMTRYDPIADAAGRTVGVRFVGLDFSDLVAAMKATIREMKIGATGYFYVLDARPGKTQGQLLVHPTQEGSNLLDAQDANGHPFVKEMLNTGRGVIAYDWLNKARGETQAREKLVAFAPVADWNWLICGGSYADEFTAEVRQLRNRYLALGLAMLALISAVTYFLIRALVSEPLARVHGAAAAIADGDLTVRLKTVRLDEVGKLIAATNRIGANLTTVVGAVRENSESVATASAQIAQGNHELSSRTESQASSLEQTSAAMQQLGSTVQENAGAAVDANQRARQASQVAARGGDVMTEVAATMQGINDASRRIADITSLIDGIAFQTNILALNAAVESARAGEAGRGFAVVAGEVHSLAARSAEAAREIKSLIADSVARVESGSRLVDQAGRTIAEVVASIDDVARLMTGISGASQDQATGVQQVGAAVVQMDQSTHANSALVEEMAAAADSLRGQAQSLVTAVSMFKIAAA
ncbi:MAG TPA: Cache 3/Cache 2 fusion domain-containing protein [Roseateles sp.]